MKKIKYLLMTILVAIIFPLNVFAASGNIKITGTSSAVVGNTVTISVTLSSKTTIGSWEMDLKYDKSYLKLISASTEAGGTNMVNSSSGTKSKVYTFKFKALKKGNTTISMSGYSAYAYEDMSEMDLSANSKNIRIMTQAELEASYSKDNNLKSLGIEGFEISPEFNKNTLVYSAIVPENTKEINIIAKASDYKASVSGTGTKTVTSGSNTFSLVVRAENGSEKTYTLNVEVKDPNPINVKVDGKDYTVIKIKEFLPESAYEETLVKINDFDIPAYYNSTIKKTLVGLKDTEGNAALFIYKNGKYEPYTEIKFNEVTFYHLDTDKTLEHYTLGKINLSGKEIPAYYLNKDSKFAIIYGINLNNGKEGFYKYDKTTNSLTLFDEELYNLLNTYQSKMNLYSYIIIGFSVILVIMFILLIKKRHKRKGKEYILKKEHSLIDKKTINSIEEKDEKKSLIYDDIKTKKKKKNSKK